MKLRGFLATILLTSTIPILAQAQGMTFESTFEGHAIVSEPASGMVQLDVSGEAAGRLYEHLKADKSAEHLVGRNPRGEITEDVYRNSKLMCSESRLFGTYHSCQLRMALPQ